MEYKRSSELYNRSVKVMPGGVNSPVRAFKAVGGTPLFIKEAKGSRIYDVDGYEYIDYINSWGPQILGHAHPSIVAALKEQVVRGTSFGTPTENEAIMAELVINMVGSVDKVRMVNSGTEACMSAVRLARGYTSRNKIVKFAGCYHGHSDSFLIQAGSGAATFGVPNSPGVTQGTATDTLLAPYNDLDFISELMTSNGGDVAAIIVEPVAGNMGCIPPAEGFLEALRALCTEHGSVLIFDEVMTGFRLSSSGASGVYDVEPDLFCFGKIIGGGLPVGAFAGKSEIMSHLAPDGPVYQAGTLSGNPLAMAAGITLLEILNGDKEVYDRLEKKGAYLEQGLHSVIKAANIPYVINRVGSMFSLHFSESAVVDFDSASKCDLDMFSRFFHAMKERGVYLPPSAYESWFLCDALAESDLLYTIEMTSASLKYLLSKRNTSFDLL
jgi:glutamate-1-semialdehyde 2,1-aminomutase